MKGNFIEVKDQKTSPAEKDLGVLVMKSWT